MKVLRWFGAGLAVVFGTTIASAQIIPPPQRMPNAPILQDVIQQNPLRDTKPVESIILDPAPGKGVEPGKGEPEKIQIKKPAEPAGEPSGELPAPSEETGNWFEYPADASANCDACNACNGCQEEKWGPPAVEDARVIMNTRFGKKLECHGWRMFGWLSMGYTQDDFGGEFLTVEPRPNRFGNEFLLNQIMLVLENELESGHFNLGFRADLYGGADAALYLPKGGFRTTNPRFGVDFRNLYVSAHLPVLSEGGVDLKVGRQYTIIGYENAMAPYRVFYSNGYQFFYAQDGAWTGALANWHATDRLDILAGVTMGANTFFTWRKPDSPAFIGQINYWLNDCKKTKLTASTHIGDQAIFSAPGFQGDLDTLVELRISHDFNKYFTQVVQGIGIWSNNVPAGGTGEFYDFMAISILHLNKKLDLQFRGEWVDDRDATRTGFPAEYWALTLGFDYHPCKYLRIRPELRYDEANIPVFNSGRSRDQWTAAVEALFQF